MPSEKSGIIVDFTCTSAECLMFHVIVNFLPLAERWILGFALWLISICFTTLPYLFLVSCYMTAHAILIFSQPPAYPLLVSYLIDIRFIPTWKDTILHNNKHVSFWFPSFKTKYSCLTQQSSTHFRKAQNLVPLCTIAVAYYHLSVPITALQWADSISRSLSYVPTISKSIGTQDFPFIKKIIIYSWVALLALLRLCDCHHCIGCPGRALIRPYSKHLTRFRSWRFLSNPDGPFSLFGPAYYAAFSIRISAILPPHHTITSTDHW